MLTRIFLKDLRRKALRRRLWYRSLDGLERSVFNLTCIVVDRVKSPVLGEKLLRIVVKLRNALKSEFVKLVETLGVRRAWAAAEYAVDWNYEGARAWRRDAGFARFFAVMEFNVSSSWG